MTDNTINNAKTFAARGKGAILAGWTRPPANLLKMV